MLRLGAERQELRIVDDQIGAPTSTNLLAAIVNRILQQADDISGILRKNSAISRRRRETSWYGFATSSQWRAGEAVKLAVQGVAPIPSTEYPLPATTDEFEARADQAKTPSEFRPRCGKRIWKASSTD